MSSHSFIEIHKVLILFCLIVNRIWRLIAFGKPYWIFDTFYHILYYLRDQRESNDDSFNKIHQTVYPKINYFPPRQTGFHLVNVTASQPNSVFQKNAPNGVHEAVAGRDGGSYRAASDGRVRLTGVLRAAARLAEEGKREDWRVYWMGRQYYL